MHIFLMCINLYAKDALCECVLDIGKMTQSCEG